MTGKEARGILTLAEAAGFVREPSLDVETYEIYLLDDAAEALEWLAARDMPAPAQSFAPARLFTAPATLRGQLSMGDSCHA
jgi:hypothetical protein